MWPYAILLLCLRSCTCTYALSMTKHNFDPNDFLVAFCFDHQNISDLAITFGVESWRHRPHVSVNDHDIGDLALIQVPFSMLNSPTVRLNYQNISRMTCLTLMLCTQSSASSFSLT